MSEQAYKYVIVGGGLTGSSAVDGIRELDQSGDILLIGRESHLPYDRPPLSKNLWFGQKQVEDIFVHDQAYYDSRGVTLKLDTTVVGMDAAQKMIVDSSGESHRCEKLLLATGGEPSRLPIPGGDLEGVCYYRYLGDYLRTREQAKEGAAAVVIGGGFIGSEMAAALNLNKVAVTMVFPGPYLVNRVFPEGLGRALQRHYQEKGVRIVSDAPASIERRDGRFVTHTTGGQRVESDIVIAGIGISPATKLAEQAGLGVTNGIVVNELLQTSNPDIHAAGDNALSLYQALGPGERRRVEHWDNAISQGKWAGRNLAGAGEPFTYMPYFYSDLFEFGFEAVGDVDPRLEVFEDWQKEHHKGVIYYLRDGKVRGAMMCDLWDRVEAARELIRKGGQVSPSDLRGAIR